MAKNMYRIIFLIILAFLLAMTIPPMGPGSAVFYFIELSICARLLMFRASRATRRVCIVLACIFGIAAVMEMIDGQRHAMRMQNLRMQREDGAVAVPLQPSNSCP